MPLAPEWRPSRLTEVIADLAAHLVARPERYEPPPEKAQCIDAGIGAVGYDIAIDHLVIAHGLAQPQAAQELVVLL